jgi:hypothetical protein
MEYRDIWSIKLDTRTYSHEIDEYTTKTVHEVLCLQTSTVSDI